MIRQVQPDYRSIKCDSCSTRRLVRKTVSNIDGRMQICCRQCLQVRNGSSRKLEIMNKEIQSILPGGLNNPGADSVSVRYLVDIDKRNPEISELSTPAANIESLELYQAPGDRTVSELDMVPVDDLSQPFERKTNSQTSESITAVTATANGESHQPESDALESNVFPEDAQTQPFELIDLGPPSGSSWYFVDSEMIEI